MCTAMTLVVLTPACDAHQPDVPTDPEDSAILAAAADHALSFWGEDLGSPPLFVTRQLAFNDAGHPLDRPEAYAATRHDPDVLKAVEARGFQPCEYDSSGLCEGAGNRLLAMTAPQFVGDSVFVIAIHVSRAPGDYYADGKQFYLAQRHGTWRVTETRGWLSEN